MFRTELTLAPHPEQLPLAARVLTVGSCFSDVIGARLAGFKVRTLVNPFGTVFNPLSACKLLRAAAGEEVDWQQHLVEARGRWQSYDLHASLGANSPVALLQQIQQAVQETGEFLQSTDILILTLGTAFAYRLRETQEIVSNCHKTPADRFDKELLTPDEIVAAVAETHAYLRLRNPKLRFILTVSPVRHLKDTLPLNAVSKSTLRIACHYLSELLPGVSYFPAYELLLDDLRDYRFYGPDMIHPSEVAEDYVWERFTRTYFDSSFGRFKKEWEAIRQALTHRPLHPAAPEHRQFLENTLVRLQKIAAQADVRAEIRELQKTIADLPLPPVPALAPEPEYDDDEERIDIGELESMPIIKPIVQAQAPVNQPVEVLAPDSEEESSEEMTPEAPSVPAGKKKRRSRGGAKRTARKRAALEAAHAEPAIPAPDSENFSPVLDDQAETIVEASVAVEPENTTAEEPHFQQLTLELNTESEAAEPAAEAAAPAKPVRRKSSRDSSASRAPRKTSKAPKAVSATKAPVKSSRRITAAAEAALNKLLSAQAPDAGPATPSASGSAARDTPDPQPAAIPDKAPTEKRRSRPPRRKPSPDESA